MNSRFPSRRLLLQSAAGLALFWSRSRAAAGPNDQGIGGTGVVNPNDTVTSDRGIGGTGVIGTIRRFGSIVVNDLRIAYPPDAVVTLDGKPATAADLRIGHVVRVTAQSGKDGLSTRTIAVASEVVGPVEKVGASRITVLGQTVSTANHGRNQTWTPGETVAVSGLRRPDGTIMASLIEKAPGYQPRVSGPVRLGADGTPMIGGLRLQGLPNGFDGQRVLVEGQATKGLLAVRRAGADSLSFGPDVQRVSVEAYAARGDGGARLGSGLQVSGSAANLPRSGVARVVLTGTPGAGGGLDLTDVRHGTNATGAPRAGTAPNGSTPANVRGSAGEPHGFTNTPHVGGGGPAEGASVPHESPSAPRGEFRGPGEFGGPGGFRGGGPGGGFGGGGGPGGGGHR